MRRALVKESNAVILWRLTGHTDLTITFTRRLFENFLGRLLNLFELAQERIGLHLTRGIDILDNAFGKRNWICESAAGSSHRHNRPILLRLLNVWTDMVDI